GRLILDTSPSWWTANPLLFYLMFLQSSPEYRITRRTHLQSKPANWQTSQPADQPTGRPANRQTSSLTLERIKYLPHNSSLLLDRLQLPVHLLLHELGEIRMTAGLPGQARADVGNQKRSLTLELEH